MRPFEKMTSMRENYKTDGIVGYYQKTKDSYKNLHEKDVENIVNRYLEGLDNRETAFCRILDMSAGSGEVTLACRKWERNNSRMLKITATDPFTFDLYKKRTLEECHNMNFNDIANGSLGELEFDHVVCSYALHLTNDNSELFSLLYDLCHRSKWLFVISAGKKPAIKKEWGWELSRSFAIGRCRGRVYRSTKLLKKVSIKRTQASAQSA